MTLSQAVGLFRRIVGMGVSCELHSSHDPVRDRTTYTINVTDPIDIEVLAELARKSGVDKPRVNYVVVR